MFLNNLRINFEQLEYTTVGSSFGGAATDAKAPVFNFSPIVDWSISNIQEFPSPVKEDLMRIGNFLTIQEFKYLLSALYRFSFCIELTNLRITSTKMKTRWLPVKILKTRAGTYDNYEGDFAPGQDQRASDFNECLNVLFKCIHLLSRSDEHIHTMKPLASSKHRGVPYEAVFTYIDSDASFVHQADNIRLVHLPDIIWLIQARPLIRPIINKNSLGGDSKLGDKIATKTYKTDRSQTGEVQTNRAKRWECLSQDFQHATLEECWSVERKLLNDLAHFVGFPEENKQALIRQGLFGSQVNTLCPITFRPMVLREILDGGSHGRSNFQVGHMHPLKSGGRHTGESVEWISGDGNRIQGSLSIEETRKMVVEIYESMVKNGWA